MKQVAKDAKFISLSKNIEDIFHEILAFRSYDVIHLVKFQ